MSSPCAAAELIQSKSLHSAAGKQSHVGGSARSVFLKRWPALWLANRCFFDMNMQETVDSKLPFSFYFGPYAVMQKQWHILELLFETLP